MKKLILVLCLTLGVMVSVYGTETVDKVSEFANGVSAVHDDVTSVVTTIHDDVKDVVSTVYGDSKSVVKDLYPDVKNAVVAIAKSLGVAAEHVYGVLVKKYVVIGIKELSQFLIGLVFLIIGWVKMDKIIKLNKPIDWHILYPTAMCAIAFLFMVSVDYDAMFMGLFNPEWGAINYILDYSKTLLGK